MRLPNVLVSLLTLTFTTSALPTIAPSYEDEELNVTANSHDLRTRDGYASHIWIEVFQDAYFSGTGRWAGAPKDVCSKMFYHKAGDIWSDFSDRISSLNVVSGTRCQFWEHNNCVGRYWYGSRVENLADGDGYMNDKISSFKCYGN